MGDRCYISLTCRATDASKFEELGYRRDNESTSLSPNCVDMEKDEGYVTDLFEGSEVITSLKGVPFVGQSGPGCAYGAYVFASDGIHFREVETRHGDRNVVVALDENGNPVRSELTLLRAYIRFSKHCEKILKKTKAAPPPPRPLVLAGTGF